jgi:signal transduction histidine kinase
LRCRSIKLHKFAKPLKIHDTLGRYSVPASPELAAEGGQAMLTLAQVKTDKPHNVISITRHAAFQRSGPAVQAEDPVEFVCHELLKPLTVISHSAQLLAEMPLGAFEKGLVSKIAMSSATALRYAREQQRATELQRIMMNAREFRPDAMTEELLGAAQDFAFLNGASLCAGVDKAVPDLLLAPDQRIAQLLGVFLHNAIKHGRGRTIRLSVSGKQGHGAFYTVFRVETQLPEMTDEALDRITSFQGANAHLAALFCGRGIGMASCKGLAARMGGRITVSCQPGSGQAGSGQAGSGGAGGVVAIDLAMTCKLPMIYAEPLLLV